MKKMNSSAFKNARKKASAVDLEIKKCGVHSLKHTGGFRLRAAGVPREDRKELMGHKQSKEITTHYSAPELRTMLDFLERIAAQESNLIIIKERLRLNHVV